MNRWKHVLFDLDGTLTDSKPGITRGVQQALKYFGIDQPDLNQLESYIGPPLLDSFMRVHGLREEQAREAIGVYREYYTTIGIYQHQVYPGVEALLNCLKAEGKELYVATSKPTPFAEIMLREDGLFHLFKGVYGSFLDGRRTDKAEVIQAVMAEHRLDPSATVMVGDRSHDVVGGIKRGIPVIGVLYGYGSQEELYKAGAFKTAKNVEELKHILCQHV